MKKLFKNLHDRLNTYAAKRINKHRYQKGLLSEIEYELRNEFLKEVEQFGVDDFYQNYPPLKISGRRNTLSRFKIYEMQKRLGKDLEVLDIGGNIGFFSLYLSRFVKSIDLVEQNKNLTDIGKKLAEYEKITNVNIINLDFKKYSPDKKYDMIMSLAVHGWVDMDFEEYLKKIKSLLKDGGTVLMESHMTYYSGGDNLGESLEGNKYFEVFKGGIVDDDKGRCREFFWLKAK
jgi:2-polyprenyl-3-methyl-5-hydroxy-6-metoxy-1,4-benzoquinol methylase